jgi:hypothetical protein
MALVETAQGAKAEEAEEAVARRRMAAAASRTVVTASVHHRSLLPLPLPLSRVRSADVPTWENAAPRTPPYSSERPQPQPQPQMMMMMMMWVADRGYEMQQHSPFAVAPTTRGQTCRECVCVCVDAGSRSLCDDFLPLRDKC